MATASPPSVIVLIDRPNNVNTIAVMTTDNGIAVSVMKVVRKLSRNRNRMTTTSRLPSRKRLDDVVDRQVDERLLLVQLRVRSGCRPGSAVLSSSRAAVTSSVTRARVGLGLLVDRQHHGRPPAKRRPAGRRPRCRPV